MMGAAIEVGVQLRMKPLDSSNHQAHSTGERKVGGKGGRVFSAFGTANL